MSSCTPMTFSLLEFIQNIPIEEFSGHIEGKIFKPILLAKNISQNDFDEFIDINGVRPFGLILSWEDGNVYLLDVASRAHEIISSTFGHVLMSKMEMLYGEIFYTCGSHAIDSSTRTFLPDFSIYVDPDYTQNISVDYICIIGEVAVSQQTSDVLEKCKNYFDMVNVSVVICIDLVEVFVTADEQSMDISSSRLSSRSKTSTRFRQLSGGNFQKKMYIYIFYDKTDYELIEAKFDEYFTLRIRREAIERHFYPSIKNPINSNEMYLELVMQLKSSLALRP